MTLMHTAGSGQRAARKPLGSIAALAAAVTAVAAIAWVPSSAEAAAGSPQRIRISMPTREGALFAPYNIAVEKGYYKEEGLELAVTIAGGGVSVSAQLAGDLDVNASGPSAIVPIMRGAKLKIIYTMATHCTDQIWSTSRAITSLQQLKGQQVGVITRGDTTEVGVKMALVKSGLPADYLNYTALGQINNLLATMKMGSLPAVVLAGITVEQARDAGYLSKGTLLLDERDSIQMPYNSVAVTDDYLQKNRAALERFLRATEKGIRFMKANKAQSVVIMRRYSAANERALAADYERLEPVLSMDGTVPEAARLADLKMRASLINLPPARIPPISRIYDYGITQAVNKQLDASGWKP